MCQVEVKGAGPGGSDHQLLRLATRSKTKITVSNLIFLVGLFWWFKKKRKVGSLPYKIKHHEVTTVVIWGYINKIS